MTVIAINEWTPDSSDFGNPGAPSVTNALPGLTSYQPMPSLVVTTNALTGRPLGAISAQDSTGNYFAYAGDTTKLYKISSLTWGDASKVAGYNTGDGERWEFMRWKEKVLATNFSDSPQQLAFSGSTFSDLTTALRFKHMGAVREFVVAGNTFDGTDGAVSDRVRWSAVGDETDWTVSTTTQAGFRDLLVGGPIQKVVGGDYGVIVSEKSMFRMVYVGSPQVFEIDETIPGIGALSPGGVVTLGGVVYVWTEHGMVAVENGAQVNWIGQGKVDRFLRNDLDENYTSRISSVADPTSGRIFWAYPGAGNTDGLPNKIVVYDRVLNKWGYLEQEVELLWRSAGVATTLEGLDSISASIDALGTSLDSAQWKGGVPALSAFDSAKKSGDFNGDNMTATIELKEIELNPGKRTALAAFRPLVDGGTTTARVGYRRSLSDSVSYTPSLSESDSGRFTTRASARFHRFELTLSGAWNDAIGVRIDRADARPVEGRG